MHDNEPMKRVFAKAGARWRNDGAGVLVSRMSTDALAALAPPDAAPALRQVADRIIAAAVAPHRPHHHGSGNQPD